jgi:glutamine amidotransferase
MIAILKYNAGNATSVKNALNRLGCNAVITDNPIQLRLADRVIIPGVGEAGTAMEYLKKNQLDRVIISLQQPVLGICLGLQIMCSYSEEGNTPCLGIFDNRVKKFPALDKVPHMGWNNLVNFSGPLLANLPAQPDVYFVHSYYAELSSDTIATCNYILPFSAAQQKNNFYVTQFHVEKSAGVGEQILKNFLSL